MEGHQKHARPMLSSLGFARLPHAARRFFRHKKITDPDSLRSHLQESICVCLNIEGREDSQQGIQSIGISILSPTLVRSEVFPRAPFTTQAFKDQYDATSYCWYLSSRTGHKNLITLDTAGQFVRCIINAAQRRHKCPVILVGWRTPPRLFHAVQLLAPQLFEEAVGWVEVTGMTYSVCFSQLKDAPGYLIGPSLGAVMAVVGLDPAELCSPFRSAGRDAVHTIAVLVWTLSALDYRKLPPSVNDDIADDMSETISSETHSPSSEVDGTPSTGSLDGTGTSKSAQATHAISEAEQTPILGRIRDLSLE